MPKRGVSLQRALSPLFYCIRRVAKTVFFSVI